MGILYKRGVSPESVRSVLDVGEIDTLRKVFNGAGKVPRILVVSDSQYREAIIEE